LAIEEEKNNALPFMRNFGSFPVDEGKFIIRAEHQLISIKYQLMNINSQ